MRCPVCEGPEGRPFQVIDGRAYGRCGCCEATFLLPEHWPTPEAERAEYALHRNASDDAGYRGFLQTVVAPLLQRLPPAQHGLDYGCGPGPVLASMLREAGHTVALYDPVYQRDPTPLTGSYHFVTCTEVAEHFHRPADEFRRLDALLRPGGWLALMTCFQTDDARFAQWHYRRDPTHVVFYREATLRWLARHHGWRCEVPCANVALMQKSVTG
ncbi:MAG: class I SAM-dependent methyltransferase [Hydrogenophaga sp.]|jgi:hypothetical protein|uniref:class I SAM-dependent methyltransferase n=1 Tax=Hydrogenophaga sp. TaxID=1904254 RepID=UPI002610F36A|nr:class I SAM-dependent methyltransferase [Hydrogenophaga sp.]MCV0438166.1 class I SAM-dependent methyltransferase [Hydrogenophaga sp.]